MNRIGRAAVCVGNEQLIHLVGLGSEFDVISQ